MPSPPSQLLLLGVPGPELRPEDAELLRAIQPGGFILTGRNIVSLEQTRRLTDDLRSLCEIEPFLCVASNGGDSPSLVTDAPPLPSAGEMRLRNDPRLITRHGWITGRLLRLMGINFNLAPALEIGGLPAPPGGTGDQSWGEDDQQVINNAGTFNRYQRRQGVLGCGRSFPRGDPAGFGASQDPPVVDLTIDELMRSDLIPYTALMPELDGIMMSPVHCSRIDSAQPGLPAALSRRIITGLLRDQLGYKRLVLIEGIDHLADRRSLDAPEVARRAAQAGADLLVIGNEIRAAPSLIAVLDELPGYTLVDALERIEFAKKRLHGPTTRTDKALELIGEDLRALREDLEA